MFKLSQILCRAAKNPRLFYPVARKTALKKFVAQKVRLCNRDSLRLGPKLVRKCPDFKLLNVAFALNILTWLGFNEDDEKKESELIMTLKRAVLCTQREEYEKAEQMLHLALR